MLEIIHTTSFIWFSWRSRLTEVYCIIYPTPAPNMLGDYFYGRLLSAMVRHTLKYCHNVVLQLIMWIYQSRIFCLYHAQQCAKKKSMWSERL